MTTPGPGDHDMESFTSFFPDLLVTALLLFGALALSPLFARIGLPGPAAFLAAGVGAGLLGVVPFGSLREQPLQEIGVVALYGILFQGGLSTGFASFRANARAVTLLGVLGTAATAGGVALAGRVIGLDWPLAILVGVALAPTDPAAVYATLRHQAGNGRARAILEGESGFNDPVGITFMVITLAALGSEGASFRDGVVVLAAQLGIGLIGGVLGAGALLGLLRATHHLEDALQGIAMLVAAVIVGAGTASLEGSGFLAVYICGLVVSDAWSRQDSSNHAVPASVAAVAEPILFGLLGALFAPDTTIRHLWIGIVLTLATVLVVRPPIAFLCLVRSGLNRGEKLLVSWGGLKGAVPLLLAAYPALESLDETIDVESIVLVATAASIVLQGATLRLFSREVEAPREQDPGIVHGRAKAGG